MCHSYEAVYSDEKGRPVAVAPVVGFDAEGNALMCNEEGRLDRVDAPGNFDHVRPVGNLS